MFLFRVGGGGETRTRTAYSATCFQDRLLTIRNTPPLLYLCQHFQFSLLFKSKQIDRFFSTFTPLAEGEPANLKNSKIVNWRRGWDSNPRGIAPNTLAPCRFRPLSHLSLILPCFLFYHPGSLLSILFLLISTFVLLIPNYSQRSFCYL